MPSVICFIHLHSELTDERFMCFGGVMRPGNTQTNLHRVPYSPLCLSVFCSLPLITLYIFDCMWASELLVTLVVYTCKSNCDCVWRQRCVCLLDVKNIFWTWGHKELHLMPYSWRFLHVSHSPYWNGQSWSMNTKEASWLCVCNCIYTHVWVSISTIELSKWFS